MSGAVEHKDGGRAFPCDQIIERDANGHLYGKEVASGGMTLRDYFAGQVLISEVRNMTTWGYAKRIANNAMRKGYADPLSYIADNCYEMADAMLKARQS